MLKLRKTQARSDPCCPPGNTDSVTNLTLSPLPYQFYLHFRGTAKEALPLLAASFMCITHPAVHFGFSGLQLESLIFFSYLTGVKQDLFMLFAT